MLANLAQLSIGGHPIGRRIAELELLSQIFVLQTLTANGTKLKEPQPEAIAVANEGDGEESLKQQNGASKANPQMSAQFFTVDWRQSKGFSRLSPLLGSPHYGRNALAGFVLSAGSFQKLNIFTKKLCFPFRKCLRLDT